MKKLHPLTLILAALWLSTAAILLRPWPALGVVFVLSVVFRAALADWEPLLWLRQLLKLLPVLAAVVLIQVLFVKTGRPLWGQAWYAVHAGGLEGGVSVSLRLLILFWSAQVLLKLDYEDFDAAFQALRLPEELGFMVFYTIHVIPLATQQVRASLQLLRLRGISLRDLPLNARLELYRVISLAGLGEVLSRSEIQATALDLRGFRSSGKRSFLCKRGFDLSDALLGLLLAGLTLACFLLQR